MSKYIILRFLEIIPTLFLISLIVFTAMHIAPGDPATLKMGRAGAQNPEALLKLKKSMGLDKPVLYQYNIWLKSFLRGELGKSNRSGMKVSKLILSRIPASIQLIILSLLLTLIIFLPLGIISVLNYNKLYDHIISIFIVAGVAIPGFWLGLTLIIIFSVWLGVLPSSGYTPFTENPIESIKKSIMPTITLSVYLIATFTRFLRSEMIQVLNEDYIRTAISKGISTKNIILRHTLRNSMIPLITIFGIEVGSLLGGVVIIEHVFGWSGLGWLTLQAVYNRDYPLVQGSVMLIAIAYCLINFIVDICYSYLNPQIREQYLN